MPTSTAGATTSKVVARTARSVYVSRLRRAFLLRVHPDRFRNHSDSIRQKQASLVKALMNRMNQTDFISWQSSGAGRDSSPNFQCDENHYTDNRRKFMHPYFIEKRDGTLLSTQLNLSDRADDILNEMSRALKESGAATPLLPLTSLQQQPQNQDTLCDQQQSVRLEFGQQYNQNIGSNIFYARAAKNGQQSYTIDHQYDVASRRGRDLKSFLIEMSSLGDMIHERRLHRMDAQALASAARKVFKFQSVDPVPSGWSSASVGVLLRRLLDLHNDHASEFHVSSFYPLRLVFTPTDVGDERSYLFPDDDHHHPKSNDTSRPLDIHEGVIRLHPACTSQQWLKTIQLITPKTLEFVRSHRAVVMKRNQVVAAALGIKIRKGHSCSSWEYYSFLQRLVPLKTEHSHNCKEKDRQQLVASLPCYASSIALQPDTLVIATVESPNAIRRANLTKEGHIRLNAQMDVGDCRQAIERLSPKARELAAIHSAERQKCSETIHAVQTNFGLQKVYRASPTVSHEQFHHSLQRMLVLMNNTGRECSGVDFDLMEEHNFLKRQLAGNSLGIAGEGQFCQLADDGSVVIPYNWIYLRK